MPLSFCWVTPLPSTINMAFTANYHSPNHLRIAIVLVHCTNAQAEGTHSFLQGMWNRTLGLWCTMVTGAGPPPMFLTVSFP